MAREKTYGPYTAMYRLQEDHVNFFSKGAMRFFNSRVGDTLYGGRIFVTSERYDHTTPRLYSVRIATADNIIEELSDFQEYTSSRAARTAARMWYDRLKDILPTITAADVRLATMVYSVSFIDANGDEVRSFTYRTFEEAKNAGNIHVDSGKGKTVISRLDGKRLDAEFASLTNASPTA